MTMLAIDQSTMTGSLALLRDQVVLAEVSWQETRGTGHQFFTHFRAALDQCGLSPADLDTFAVGLGPGVFSGLRMSLAAAHGLALPGSRPVYGVNSAAALARELADRHNVPAAAVIGDARRGRFWMVTSDTDQPGLVSESQLPAQLEGIPIVATSDWERIGGILQDNVPDETTLIEETCVPRATTIGRWITEQVNNNTATPAQSPIYLHPAVANPSQQKQKRKESCP